MNRTRAAFLALAVTSVAACVGSTDPLAPAGESFGRRIQGMTERLSPSAIAEAGSRRVAKLTSQLDDLPSSEFSRIQALTSTSELALDRLARSMVKFTSSGARITRLVGIDTAPLPEPTDADRSTNPFLEPEKTGFLTRVMNRIGF